MNTNKDLMLFAMGHGKIHNCSLQIIQRVENVATEREMKVVNGNPPFPLLHKREN